MLITKHFVLLHYPRTGGVFFRRMCQQHLPPEWELRELPEPHAYYSAIPPESAALPVFCLIRNPWDWYVSWYEFTIDLMARRPPKGPIRPTNPWNTVFGAGSHDFRQTAIVCCTRDEGNRYWEIAMRHWDCDLFSAWFWLMTGHVPSPPPADSPLASQFPPRARPVETGRYESFREDFTAFVERNEIPAPPGFMDALRNEPPRHASVRRPYREYYDDELRELVGSKARRLIEQYGYEF